MKISEVIREIIARHPPLERPDSVDVVKYGDPEKECTGVAVTCYATSDVIRKAAELGVNLVVVHEPTFFNDRDHVDRLKGDSEMKLLIGCTEEETAIAEEFHNESEYMKGLLIRRSK